MTFRFTPKTLFGATAMLALGAALAVAQDTSKTKPRSDRRIPISKEAPGEVVRTDTVMIYRTDTLQLTTRVVDTVRMTRTRVDTVIPKPPPITLPNGFYVGAAGGFSTPSGALYIPNSTGGAAQLQVGWQRAKEVFGGRFDINGTWPGWDSRFSAFHDRASIVTYNLDAKAQWSIPWFGSNSNTTHNSSDPCEPTTYKQGAYHRFSIYGIGGFTYATYKNLPMRLDFDNFNDFNDANFLNNTNRNIAVIDPRGTVTVVTNDNRNTLIVNNQNRDQLTFFRIDNESHSRGGWNAGGGVSMVWGHTEMFLEARVLGFNVDRNFDNFNNIGNGPSARTIPVTFGINWY